jgi:hypothetical protein
MAILKTLAKAAAAAGTAFAVGTLTASAPAQADPAMVTIQPDDQIYDFIRAVNEVTNQFHLSGITVSTGDIGFGVYAGSGHHGNIVVSRNVSTDPAKWEAYFRNDLAQDYHHGGSCSGQRYTGFHEAAHQLDFADSELAEWEVTQKYGDGAGLPLSGYSFHPSDGTIDPAEALAEAFAAVKCGAANSVEWDLYSLLTT